MNIIVRSLMIAILMFIGTVSADAVICFDTDSHGLPLGTVSTEVTQKKKCHLRHIHDESCGGKYMVDRTKVYPEMSRKLRRHIFKGHHKYHRDVCRRCHLSKKEIRRMEPQVKKMVAEMRMLKKQKHHKQRRNRHEGREQKNSVA